jgi:hypothetical protein
MGDVAVGEKIFKSAALGACTSPLRGRRPLRVVAQAARRVTRCAAAAAAARADAARARALSPQPSAPSATRPSPAAATSRWGFACTIWEVVVVAWGREDAGSHRPHGSVASPGDRGRAAKRQPRVSTSRRAPTWAACSAGLRARPLASRTARPTRRRPSVRGVGRARTRTRRGFEPPTCNRGVDATGIHGAPAASVFKRERDAGWLALDGRLSRTHPFAGAFAATNRSGCLRSIRPPAPPPLCPYAPRGRPSGAGVQCGGERSRPDCVDWIAGSGTCAGGPAVATAAGRRAPARPASGARAPGHTPRARRRRAALTGPAVPGAAAAGPFATARVHTIPL